MSQIDYSRLHSTDSEQSVLGALLLPGSNAIDRIGHLKPGHFFTEAHRIIFGEIVAMAAQAMAVDPVTVAERLESSGLSDKTGGLVYLGDLASNTPSAASCGHYAKIVSQGFEREPVSAADKIQSITAGLGSTREKMTDAQSAIMQITESAEPQKPKHIREVLIRAVAAIERRGDGSDNAMATGFHALDQKLSGGFRRGNLVVVAGRPGMVKTALSGCLAYSAASNGIPTSVYWMEMQDTNWLRSPDRHCRAACRLMTSWPATWKAMSATALWLELRAFTNCPW